MARLLFTRRAVIGSTLIRAATWSDWSHVQSFKDDATLIGAGWPEGVAEEPFEARMTIASKAAVMTIPLPDEDAGMRFLMEQMGKPYDTAGMLGLGLHRDWQSDDAWWCSELGAAYVQAGGRQLFRDSSLRRVTPQHLWMLPFDVQVLK